MEQRTLPTAHRIAGGIGTYEWDPVHRVLRWDETAASLFETPDPTEPAFEAWRRCIHPDDEARVLARFTELAPAEALYRVVDRDGSVRYVLTRGTHVVEPDDGRPPYVAGIVMDLTEVHALAGRAEDILGSISDGFYSLDHQFRFLYINPASERILDVDARELLGQELWDIYPAVCGTEFEQVYRRVMASREPATFQAFFPEPFNGWYEVSVQPTADGIAVYFQDVTEGRAREVEREVLLRSERRARREIARQAAHDQLTGLLNRQEITRRGQRLLDEGEHLTVLFLDLDRFKNVNDTLGHTAGDALLIEVANRLREALRAQDASARLGGDEYVILLAGVSPAVAERVAERILRDVRRPVRIGERELQVTISIGLASHDEPAALDALLRDADIALYRAKASGRDRFAWYDTDLHTEILEHVELEADLRHGLVADQIQVHHQPVFDLASGRMVGVEALARWAHPTRGWVPPATFIPLAEETGQIAGLGEAVLRRAASDATRWHADGVRTWVNVSPHQIRVPGLAATVLHAARTAGLPASSLGVEITESALADDHIARRELAGLADAGVAIAIDDFGTGYSSLGRLQALPITTLKIDQSFARDVETTRGRAAVTAIIELAHALDLVTVGEGVETWGQLEALRDLGADRASGYLLARPGPAEAIDPDSPMPDRAGLPG